MSLTVPRCVMTPFFPLPCHVQEILHIHLDGFILSLGLDIILAEGMQETSWWWVLGVTKDIPSEVVNIHACFSLCHTERLNIGKHPLTPVLIPLCSITSPMWPWMIHECLSIRWNLSLCLLFVASSGTSFWHLPVQRGSCQFLSQKPVLLGSHHNLPGKMVCLLCLPTRVSSL